MAKCEQWPSIHSHRGITECFLSSLPLCIYFGVCVCVCPCKRVQRAQRTRRKGERMRVGGGDSLVFVRVCVAFSLLWLTTKIPHCSSLADMAFSFPFELPPPHLHFHFQTRRRSGSFVLPSCTLTSFLASRLKNVTLSSLEEPCAVPAPYLTHTPPAIDLQKCSFLPDLQTQVLIRRKLFSPII